MSQENWWSSLSFAVLETYKIFSSKIAHFLSIKSNRMMIKSIQPFCQGILFRIPFWPSVSLERHCFILSQTLFLKKTFLYICQSRQKVRYVQLDKHKKHADGESKFFIWNRLKTETKTCVEYPLRSSTSSANGDFHNGFDQLVVSSGSRHAVFVIAKCSARWLGREKRFAVWGQRGENMRLWIGPIDV